MKRYLTLCALAALPATAEVSLPDHAENVLLHVIAHEMGHAVIREFDLPILTSEEMMADDFATLALHFLKPGRAEDVVTDYARFMMSDNDVESIFSEHPDDAKRAGRALCLLYGAHPALYQNVADEFGLEGDDAANCRDTGPEVARSWRRLMAPYLMPENARVTEARITFDESSDIATYLSDSEVMQDAFEMLTAFDWHSQITLHIGKCDYSASWSRNGRQITVCDAYIQRFADVR